MARSSASARSSGGPRGRRPLRGGHHELLEHPLLDASPQEQQAAVLRRDAPPLAVLALARSARSEPELLGAIAENRHWIGYHDIVQALCANRRTPLRCTLALLPRLYPLELLQLLSYVQLPAALRTAARHLLETRVGTLSAGERLGLARNARGPAVAALLDRESEPRVLVALLDNPAVREIDVLRLVSSSATQAQALATVGRHPRWARCHRAACLLVQNPKTPPDVALALVETLHLQDLREVLADARVGSVVRLVATRYLQEKQHTGPFSSPERRKTHE